MTRPAPRMPPSATCTYALRMGDSRYVTDLAEATGSYSIDNAYLWLWPIGDTDEARAERVAAIVKRYPWIGGAVAVRAHS